MVRAGNRHRLSRPLHAIERRYRVDLCRTHLDAVVVRKWVNGDLFTAGCNGEQMAARSCKINRRIRADGDNLRRHVTAESIRQHPVPTILSHVHGRI